MNKLDDAQRLIDQFRGNDPRRFADRSPVGWDLTRERLSTELQTRIAPNLPDNFPDQGRTSRCGPAAFLYCLLENRPDLHVKFALDLWQQGRSNLKNGSGGDYWVQPGAGTIGNLPKARLGTISLDWMTMGSLSKPDHGDADPGDQLSAITYPRNLSEWFVAAGATPVFWKFNSVFGDGWLGTIDVFDLRNAFAFYGRGWIVLEINPDIIEGQSASIVSRHWVVVSEKRVPRFGTLTPAQFAQVTSRDLLKGEPVDINCACWGRRDYRLKQGALVSDFLKAWYGAAVFPAIP